MAQTELNYLFLSITINLKAILALTSYLACTSLCGNTNQEAQAINHGLDEPNRLCKNPSDCEFTAYPNCASYLGGTKRCTGKPWEVRARDDLPNRLPCGRICGNSGDCESSLCPNCATYNPGIWPK